MHRGHLYALAVVCLLLTNDTAAIFREDDAVPVMVAIIELCAQRFPEYREQNAQAFSEWRSRNESFAAKAENDKDFRKRVDTMKRVLTEAIPIPIDDAQWKKTCSTLPAELRRPESNIRSAPQ